MEEIRLNCGKGGDDLCALRSKSVSCPYYDNENCHHFIPDRSSTHPSKRKSSSHKLDSIARNLILVCQEYTDGDLDEKTFRCMVAALGMMAMGISPRQTESMLNAAKMDIVSKQLDSIDIEKIISDLKSLEGAE